MPCIASIIKVFLPCFRYGPAGDRIDGRLAAAAPRGAVHHQSPVDPETVERIGRHVGRGLTGREAKFDRLAEADELKGLWTFNLAPNPLRLVGALAGSANVDADAFANKRAPIIGISTRLETVRNMVVTSWLQRVRVAGKLAGA